MWPRLTASRAGFLVGVSCQHNPHGVGRIFFQLDQEIDAVHPGHLHVGDHQRVGRAAGALGEGFLGAEGDVDAKFLAQRALKAGQNIGIVINEEDFRVHKLDASVAHE